MDQTLRQMQLTIEVAGAMSEERGPGLAEVPGSTYRVPFPQSRLGREQREPETLLAQAKLILGSAPAT
jgi:hypothetical protein